MKLFTTLKKPVALALAAIMAVSLIPASPVSAKAKYKTKTEDGKEYIIFGKYEQDGNTKNGKEPIEWEVLGEDKKGIFVVSRYILDCQPYNEEYTYVTWQTCTLRKWLNKDFYKTAFNAKEQKKIKTVKVKNADNKEFETDGGKNTKDKIFCLSLDEIFKYYTFNTYREWTTLENFFTGYGYCQDLIISPTKYAKDRGVLTDVITREEYNNWGYSTDKYMYSEDCIDREGGYWWLRSIQWHTDTNHSALKVDSEGCTGQRSGADVIHEDYDIWYYDTGESYYEYYYYNDIGVRPAMYLKK